MNFTLPLISNFNFRKLITFWEYCSIVDAEKSKIHGNQSHISIIISFEFMIKMEGNELEFIQQNEIVIIAIKYLFESIDLVWFVFNTSSEYILNAHHLNEMKL